MTNIEEMKKAKGVEELNITGKRVFIRVDYNVPLNDDFSVSDDKRIAESMKTIRYALSKNAKIILASHLGRPKGAPDDAFSLKHILPTLEKHLGQKVLFVPSLQAQDLQKLNTLKSGEVALLENIRFTPDEEKNNPALAQILAPYCDVFVNDAFGTAHRKHASTYALPQIMKEKAAGFLLKSEIDAFDKALSKPARPLTLIVGGAKISGKLDLLKNVLSVVNNIVIGGAMSFTFLKQQGYNVGRSLVEDELLGDAQKILQEAVQKNVQIFLPVDVVCADDIQNPTQIKTLSVKEIPSHLMGLDIGDATLKIYNDIVAKSKTIIWNGPMGVFEIKEFARGTFELANAVAKSEGYSVIGGGDTADAVVKAGCQNTVDYISTGGGASLEILEGKVLPAYQILIN